MIIDYTYFTGILSVGLNYATGADDVTNNANLAELQNFIDGYEPQYLGELLGDSVATEFEAYLDDTEAEPQQRWEELKAALRSTGGISPLACYVYFKLLEAANYHMTEVGVTNRVAGNQSPLQLQIRAWNMMARAHRTIYDNLLSNGNYSGYELNTLLCRTKNVLGI